MIEILIFSIVCGSLLVAHFAVAVAYKIRTKSKKSVWYIAEHIL